MLWSRWSLFHLLSPIPSVTFPSSCRLYQVYQLQLVLPSTVFSTLWQNPSICQSFYFHSMICSNNKIHLMTNCLFFFFFFLSIKTRSGLLVWIGWGVHFICILKSQRILWVLFSWTDSGWCKYHLSLCSTFNFLHNSQWITLLYYVLYSVCASFSAYMINHFVFVST